MRTQGIHHRIGMLIAPLWVLATLGCGNQDNSPPPASISADLPAPSTSSLQEKKLPENSLTQPAEIQRATAPQRAMVVPAGPIAELPVEKDFPLKPVSPEVVIKTSQGDIRIRLNYEKAPETVGNFLANYVDQQFYDGTLIHYVEKDFMIIGGGFTADYQAKPAKYTVRCESDNGLKNLRGTVGMTRLPDYVDSATSQFYINLTDNPELDFRSQDSASSWGYCVFGKVVEGMDVAERIASLPVTDREQFPKTPVEPVIIKTIERVQ